MSRSAGIRVALLVALLGLLSAFASASECGKEVSVIYGPITENTGDDDAESLPYPLFKAPISIQKGGGTLTRDPHDGVFILGTEGSEIYVNDVVDARTADVLSDESDLCETPKESQNFVGVQDEEDAEGPPSFVVNLVDKKDGDSDEQADMCCPSGQPGIRGMWFAVNEVATVRDLISAATRGYPQDGAENSLFPCHGQITSLSLQGKVLKDDDVLSSENKAGPYEVTCDIASVHITGGYNFGEAFDIRSSPSAQLSTLKTKASSVLGNANADLVGKSPVVGFSPLDDVARVPALNDIVEQVDGFTQSDGKSKVRLLVRFANMVVWQVRHPRFSTPAILQLPETATVAMVKAEAQKYFKQTISTLAIDDKEQHALDDASTSASLVSATASGQGSTKTILVLASTEGGVVVHGIDWSLAHNTVVTMMPTDPLKEAKAPMVKFFNNREIQGFYSGPDFVKTSDETPIQNVPGFDSDKKELTVYPHFVQSIVVVVKNGERSLPFNVPEKATIAQVIQIANAASHMFNKEIVKLGEDSTDSAPLSGDRLVSTLVVGSIRGAQFPVKLKAIADEVWGAKAQAWLDGLGLSESTKRILKPIAAVEGRNFVSNSKLVFPTVANKADREKLLSGLNAQSSLRMCNTDEDCNTPTGEPERFEACMSDHVGSIYVIKRCLFLNVADFPMSRFKTASAEKPQEKVVDNLLDSFDRARAPRPAFNARADPNCATASAIKNQGRCGTCWAYAASSAYSMRLCRQTNGMVDMFMSPGSLFVRMDKPTTPDMAAHVDFEEDLITNNKADEIIRFNKELGSSPKHAYKSIREEFSQGGVPEVCRPLQCVNKDGQSAAIAPMIHEVCKDEAVVPRLQTVYGKDEKTGSFEIEGFIRDYAGSVSRVYTELIEKGPLVVPIKVMSPSNAKDQSLWKFNNGIYSPMRFLDAVDHAVVLVGWGEREDPITKEIQMYWILQNSYGKQWWPSRDGLFRVQRGFNKKCLERAKANSLSVEDTHIDCGMDYLFALELLAQQMDGLQAPLVSEKTEVALSKVFEKCSATKCKNGGVPYVEGDACKCLCPEKWGGAVCDRCVNTDCPKDASMILNQSTCECQCEQPTRWGDRCQYFMRASACPNPNGLGTKLVFKEWNTRGEPAFANDPRNTATLKLRTPDFETNVKVTLPSDQQSSSFEVEAEVLPEGVMWKQAFKQVAIGQDEFGRVNRGMQAIELDTSSCTLPVTLEGKTYHLPLSAPISTVLRSHGLALSTPLELQNGEAVEPTKLVGELAHLRSAESHFAIALTTLKNAKSDGSNKKTPQAPNPKPPKTSSSTHVLAPVEVPSEATNYLEVNVCPIGSEGTSSYMMPVNWNILEPIPSEISTKVKLASGESILLDLVLKTGHAVATTDQKAAYKQKMQELLRAHDIYSCESVGEKVAAAIKCSEQSRSACWAAYKSGRGGSDGEICQDILGGEQNVDICLRMVNSDKEISALCSVEMGINKYKTKLLIDGLKEDTEIGEGFFENVIDASADKIASLSIPSMGDVEVRVSKSCENTVEQETPADAPVSDERAVGNEQHIYQCNAHFIGARGSDSHPNFVAGLTDCAKMEGKEFNPGAAPMGTYLNCVCSGCGMKVEGATNGNKVCRK